MIGNQFIKGKESQSQRDKEESKHYQDFEVVGDVLNKRQGEQAKVYV